jgi:hypothetical protein
MTSTSSSSANINPYDTAAAATRPVDAKASGMDQSVDFSAVFGNTVQPLAAQPLVASKSAIANRPTIRVKRQRAEDGTAVNTLVVEDKGHSRPLTAAEFATSVKQEVALAAAVSNSIAAGQAGTVIDAKLDAKEIVRISETEFAQKMAKIKADKMAAAASAAASAVFPARASDPVTPLKFDMSGFATGGFPPAGGDSKSQLSFGGVASQAPAAICSSAPAKPSFTGFRTPTSQTPLTKEQRLQLLQLINEREALSAASDPKKVTKAQADINVITDKAKQLTTATGVFHPDIVTAQNVTLTSDRDYSQGVSGFKRFYSNPQNQKMAALVYYKSHNMNYTSMKHVPKETKADVMKSAKELSQKDQTLFQSEFIDLFHVPFEISEWTKGSDERLTGASGIVVKTSFFQLFCAVREEYKLEVLFSDAKLASAHLYTFSAYIKGEEDSGLQSFTLIDMLLPAEGIVYDRSPFTGSLGRTANATTEKKRIAWGQILLKMQHFLTYSKNAIILEGEIEAVKFALKSIPMQQPPAETAAQVQQLLAQIQQLTTQIQQLQNEVNNLAAFRSEYATLYSRMNGFAAANPNASGLMNMMLSTCPIAKAHFAPPAKK